MKKILVLLQNAYGVKKGYIPSYEMESFRNCHTGRRLKTALPENAIIEIRNCNPGVGRTSTAWFPPSIEYVTQQINEIAPDIILACGNNAKIVMNNITISIPVVYMPHPAYRALTNKVVECIKNILSELVNT